MKAKGYKNGKMNQNKSGEKSLKAKRKWILSTRKEIGLHRHTRMYGEQYTTSANAKICFRHTYQPRISSIHLVWHRKFSKKKKKYTIFIQYVYVYVKNTKRTREKRVGITTNTTLKVFAFIQG